MSAARDHLSVRPELCDRCGKCVSACRAGHLRVGAGYIYVDATACDNCFECVRVCDRGAISRSGASGSSSSLSAKRSGTGAAQVVVGSRAEAKAVRKAAETAASHQAKAAKPHARVGGRAATPKPGAGRASQLGAKANGKPSETTAGVAWTVADAVTVGGLLLLSYLAKDVLLGSRAVAVMPPGGRVAVRAVMLGVAHVGLIALLVFLARRHGQRFAAAFRLDRSSGVGADAAASAGLVLGFLLATRLASTAWGAIAQAAGWMPPASESLVGVFGGGGAGLVLAVVMVVLVGPFAEELAFRGVIAGALRERFGTRVAIVGSSAVFSLYHVTPWALVPTFLLGLALAWLAFDRKTLWPAIVLHALYNGVVVAAAFWLPGA